MIHGTWEPQPATRWEDAFLSGNGRHGAMVFGDPLDERVIVNHHSLVRPNNSDGARAPRLAAGLPALQDRLLAGDTTAAERFTDGRGLMWVRPFHPAFQVRIRREAEARGRYRREVDFATGVVAASCADWDSRVFVSRADDVIVQYVTGSALSVNVMLDHLLPGAPGALTIGRGTAVTREGAWLSLRAGYPHRELEYTGVTVVAAHGGRTAVTAEGIRIEGAQSLLLLTRVQRHAGELDVVAEAATLRALLLDRLTYPYEDGVLAKSQPASPGSRGAERGAYERLLARHEALHRTAYQRVTLDLQGEEHERDLPGSELLACPKSPALLERLFAAGRYHLLSSSGTLPPRLTGLWTGDWNTAWSGAFTTNANLNLQTAGAAAAALPEVTEAHGALVYGQLRDWRDNARTIFGTRGIVAPAHTDGECGHTVHFDRPYPHHVWTAGADWLLKPLLDHAETMGENDPRLIAALGELAQFYEDFLTCTGPDGRLVIVPSYSPENQPRNAGWVAVNAAMDIAAARHALTTAAELHGTARWRTLADRLPPYRINDDGALAEWAWPGLEDKYDHRHISHLYAVWPLEEINPYDTPELAVAAHRALQLRGAENNSAHGHLHQGLVASRLRDAARAEQSLAHVLTGNYFHDSLMSAHYPDRNVYNADAAHALPALIIEMFLQSTPHRLILLPAPPATYPSGALRGICTRFGAGVDLTWNHEACTALIRPSRTCRIELRTSAGVEPLDLIAGEDRVLTL